jgi:hypothetical protein
LYGLPSDLGYSSSGVARARQKMNFLLPCRLAPLSNVITRENLKPKNLL